MSIRDRGYQGYTGPRLGAGRSWRTIFSHSLSAALRQPWVIAALILAALWIVGWAVVEYLSLRVLDVMPEGRMAELKDMPELNAFPCFILVRWYGTALFTFVIALAGCGGALADDLGQGAFQFYFARPVTAMAYLLGKGLGGLFAVALVPGAAAAVTVLVRLSQVAPGQGALYVQLPLRGLVLALLVTVAHALPALALSSIAARRSVTQGAFAVVYLVPSMLGATLAAITRSPWPMLLSLHAQLEALGMALFGQAPDPGHPLLPWQAALAALVACQCGFFALLYWRLKRLEIGQAS